MAIATRNGAYIGGQWIEGDGERIEVTSPGSGETVGAVTASSEAQVDAAVRAAAGAFEAWRATPILERVEICRRAYDALHGARRGDRADDHARDRQDDPRVARGDGRVHRRPLPARGRGRPAARRAGAALDPGAGRHKRILVVQEPVGVVAAISPWNFPVDIAGIPIVYGLAVGCTIGLEAVGARAALRRACSSSVLDDAGFPAGHRQPGARARRDRRAAGAPPGRGLGRVHRLGRDGRAGRARRRLKNRVLELGGNGPQIVLADADIDKAADAAITGCFYLAGQCLHRGRADAGAQRSVQDALRAALVERVAKLRVGDPLDDGHRHGPAVPRRPRWSAPSSTWPTPSRRAATVVARWRQRGPVPRADGADRRHQRHGGSRRRRRSGRWLRSCGSRRSTRRSRSPTRPSSG